MTTIKITLNEGAYKEFPHIVTIYEDDKPMWEDDFDGNTTINQILRTYRNMKEE